jgi:hypothetical protein
MWFFICSWILCCSFRSNVRSYQLVLPKTPLSYMCLVLFSSATNKVTQPRYLMISTRSGYVLPPFLTSMCEGSHGRPLPFPLSLSFKQGDRVKTEVTEWRDLKVRTRSYPSPPPLPCLNVESHTATISKCTGFMRWAVWTGMFHGGHHTQNWW